MYYKVSIKTKYSGSTGGSFDLNKITFFKEESAGPVYPTECATPSWNVENNAEVVPGQILTATCATEGSTVTIYDGGEVPVVGEEASATASYTIPEDAVDGKTYTLFASAKVQGKEGVISSEEAMLFVTVKIYPTECTTPTLSLEDGAVIAPGNDITATCDSPNSTVTLVVSVVDPVQTYSEVNSSEQTIVGETGSGTASFTIPEDLSAITTYSITAFATVQGKDGEIKSQETTVTIKADPLYSGVNGVVVDPLSESIWFDLNGNPVSNPEKGLYIRVRNHKTEILLK
ncbi:MAG: hypothetical protein ACI4AK_01280 [Lepagella sp.]